MKNFLALLAGIPAVVVILLLAGLVFAADTADQVLARFARDLYSKRPAQVPHWLQLYAWEYGWYMPIPREIRKNKRQYLGLWSPEFDREFAARKGYALEPRPATLLGCGETGDLTNDIETVRQKLFLEFAAILPFGCAMRCP
ncbi:MAG: hypothetical protein ACLFUS_17805 [Candidatus Sumerlaeia bacterium]